MNFAKAVAVVASGTVLGHAITAATLPIISRLYTPSDFASQALFISLVSTAGSISALRLDIAIPFCKKKKEAYGLLKISVAFSLTIGFLFYLALFLNEQITTTLLPQNKIQPAWIGVGTALFGIYSALQSYALLHQDYRLLATNRIAQSAGAASIQICFHQILSAPSGLIAGQLSNTLIGTLLSFKKLHSLWDGISTSRIYLVAILKKHKNYPKYSTLESLANNLSIFGPIILISALGPKEEAGYISLAMTALQAPIALLGNAIGQVFVSKISDALKENRLNTEARTTLKRLTILGAPVFFIAALASPLLFPIILGATMHAM